MTTCFRLNLLAAVCLTLAASRAHAQTTWLVNNTTNIGGYVVTKLNNPQVIATP
jgi:type IV secretory pathway protease TraF